MYISDWMPLFAWQYNNKNTEYISSDPIARLFYYEMFSDLRIYLPDNLFEYAAVLPKTREI